MGVSFSINPTLPGTYILVVTDANGCLDSSEVYIVSSSLSEIEFIDNLNIYPNPSNGMFSLSFNCNTVQDIEIHINNILGEEIFYDLLNSCNGESSFDFNINGIRNSIYILTLQSDKKIINKLLFIE
jgi:hypothetical protein